MASNDARHPIGVVAERTGLSPDVLRVWERRYGVVEPTRSAGGQRIYSDADIERLTLLQQATQGGHGISHVATLSNSQLQDLVRTREKLPGAETRQPATPSGPSSAIQQALDFAVSLDPAGLEILLKRSVARYGIVAFIDSIAAPFLRAIGDQWHAGTLTVSQEHLATAVVQRVVTETAPLLTGADGSPTIVIATLEGERHANGALMAAATAASEGWRVIYLGADLPPSEIADTATRMGARAVGISIVAAEKKKRAAEHIGVLAKAVPKGTTILVGGVGAADLRDYVNDEDVVFAGSMAELGRQLAGMRREG